jgi:hypothetical protein
MSIAQDAIATMIQASGMNDVNGIYFTAVRDHVDDNPAYIGRDFDLEPREYFDPVFMRALYDYGHNKVRAGYPWAKRPPWIPAGETIFSVPPTAKSSDTPPVRR